MEFVHYSATGNTFLIFDDREALVDINNKSNMANIAETFDVDGLLYVQKSLEFDFSMRYLNRDGGEAEMCGNGARAICTYANEELKIPLTDHTYKFNTFNGPLTAKLSENGFAVNMGNPRDYNLVKVEDLFNSKHFLYAYTGVPHVVYEVENVDAIDLIESARPIRYNERFEKGTNINFYQIDKDGNCQMRTYERGVEGETLSCGTGTIAVAMALFKHHGFKSPTQIKAPGGLLTISWHEDFQDPALAGPVEFVRKGKL